MISPAGYYPCQTWFYEYDLDVESSYLDKIRRVWVERPSGESPFEVYFRYYKGAEEEGTIGDLM
jgi:hypothetical protein